MDNNFTEIFSLAAKYFYKEFKRSGGSQEKMANELGVTKSYISSVTNGSRTASLKIFEEIAFALSGKPLDEFLRVGRRIKEGRPPLQEEEKDFPESPEALVSKLSYYIIDYQRIKNALEEEKWLFKEAINMANYGVVIVSAEKKVLAYNKAYKEIFGYPEEILATRDMKALVRFGRNKMANLKKFDRELEEAFVTLKPISHHVELKDGRIINREVFPLLRDGKIIGRLVHLTDVTFAGKEETK